MNSNEVPARLIDCSLVEVCPDGSQQSLGLFTQRGMALALVKRFSHLKLEIKPWHPEFPGFTKLEVRRT